MLAPALLARLQARLTHTVRWDRLLVPIRAQLVLPQLTRHALVVRYFLLSFTARRVPHPVPQPALMVTTPLTVHAYRAPLVRMSLRTVHTV